MLTNEGDRAVRQAEVRGSDLGITPPNMHAAERERDFHMFHQLPRARGCAALHIQFISNDL